MLTDAAAAILQHYAYDAYGNALGFDPAAALTSYLYSGESFDARIGQTYLRARWYDATTGRFNRLDPFFGNTNDPQSLHKYLYVHGDPVNGWDPTGEVLLGGFGAFAARLGNFVVSTAASLSTVAYVTPELFAFAIVMPFLDDLGTVLQGDDDAERITTAGFMMMSVLPGGRILKRVVPSWLRDTPSQMTQWARTLLREHNQHGGASRRAILEMFRFAEDIAPGSIRVRGGDYGEGADLIADATLDGVTGKLARELKVYQGASFSQLGKRMDEAIHQLLGEQATFNHIMVQVTAGLLEQPDALARIRGQATAKLNKLMDRLTGVSRDYAQVIVVDEHGRQIFPVAVP